MAFNIFPTKEEIKKLNYFQEQENFLIDFSDSFQDFDKHKPLAINENDKRFIKVNDESLEKLSQRINGYNKRAFKHSITLKDFDLHLKIGRGQRKKQDALKFEVEFFNALKDNSKKYGELAKKLFKEVEEKYGKITEVIHIGKRNKKRKLVLQNGLKVTFKKGTDLADIIFIAGGISVPLSLKTTKHYYIGNFSIRQFYKDETNLAEVIRYLGFDVKEWFKSIDKEIETEPLEEKEIKQNLKELFKEVIGSNYYFVKPEGYFWMSYPLIEIEEIEDIKYKGEERQYSYIKLKLFFNNKSYRSRIQLRGTKKGEGMFYLRIHFEELF